MYRCIFENTFFKQEEMLIFFLYGIVGIQYCCRIFFSRDRRWGDRVSFRFLRIVFVVGIRGAGYLRQFRRYSFRFSLQQRRRFISFSRYSYRSQFRQFSCQYWSMVFRKQRFSMFCWQFSYVSRDGGICSISFIGFLERRLSIRIIWFRGGSIGVSKYSGLLGKFI